MNLFKQKSTPIRYLLHLTINWRPIISLYCCCVFQKISKRIYRDKALLMYQFVLLEIFVIIKYFEKYYIYNIHILTLNNVIKLKNGIFMLGWARGQAISPYEICFLATLYKCDVRITYSISRIINWICRKNIYLYIHHISFFIKNVFTRGTLVW